VASREPRLRRGVAPLRSLRVRLRRSVSDRRDAPRQYLGRVDGVFHAGILAAANWNGAGLWPGHPHPGRLDAGPPELRVRRRIGWTDGTFLIRIAMESLMRSKQTAPEANASGAFPGSSAGARRGLAPALYVAFLLFVGFSVSGSGCLDPSYYYAGVNDAKAYYSAYESARSNVESELASPTPDLMKIGIGLQDMEKYRQFIFDVASAAEEHVEFRVFHPDDYNAVMALKSDAEGTLKDQIALTDQFDRLGGWGAANAQHKVLTSGGKWNWVTLGTNPDLNPGGPTFTGKTSPRGGSGCAPGQTFIIGVGCV